MTAATDWQYGAEEGSAAQGFGKPIGHDEQAVVIVGSGAGGGTVAYELTARGHSRVSSSRPGPSSSRTTTSTTSGPRSGRWPGWTTARRPVPSGSPATSRTCRPGWSRPSAAPPRTGPARRRGSWRTSSTRRPTTATSRARTCSTGRSTWPNSLRSTTRPRRRSARRTGTAARRLPANNNYKVFANGAEKVGYKYYATGPYGTNAEPYDGRPASVQDGFNFQGDKSTAKWSTAVREIPRALDDGQARPAAGVAGRADHPRRRRQGQRGALPRQGRQSAPAGGEGRLRRRQLDRDTRGCCCSPPARCIRTGWPTPPARSAATTCGT